MAMDDCFEKLKKAFGDRLSDSDIKNIVNEVDAHIKSKKASVKKEKLDAEIQQELETMADNEAVASLVEKRNAMINAITYKKALDYVNGFDDPSTGIKALLGGTVKLAKGSRLSIDARGKAMVNEYLGKLIYDLEQDDLLPLFNSGALDRQISQELWEMKPNGRPGISGSKEAQKIAEIINKYQFTAVQRLNRAGAWISARPGYIVRQSHNTSKIRSAGFEQWRDAVLPLLDHEATFGADADVEKFLRGAYDGLSTGMHFKSKAGDTSDFNGAMFGFKGPTNLAKKVSGQRILHFKDSDAWFNYNEMFGSGNIRESVLFGLEHSARNTALMETLGTNPLSMFERLMGDLRKKYRADTKTFDRLRSESLVNLYRTVDGTERIPVNVSSSRISSGIRMVQNMAKLGSAVVSSISDIPFQAAELRYQGHGLLEAYGNAFHSLIRGRGRGEQREIARLLGVGFEGFANDIVSRFSVQDTAPGRMAKLQQRFFKLNGMSWWNDAHKTGVGLIMANDLAHKADLPFDKLPTATKRVFDQYAIGQKEWDLYRRGVYTAENGYKYLTPDKVQNLDDATIKQYIGDNDASPSKIQQTKDRLETDMRSYYSDRVDHAIPHPGAAERAMMTRGTQPGTLMGEVLRFMMQFKSFPLTALHKGFGREMYGYGAKSLKEAMVGGKGDLVGLAHIMAATTVFGYMAQTAKEALKGRSPRDPSKPETVMAAMAQGGGLGIYGDFLFGEFSRYGRSALATTAGPTIGQFDDVMDIYTRARQGEDVAPGLMRMVTGNTPFINLFYTRTALDYLFLYQLQETVNPGYLRRMESRVKRENNQEFFMPPSKMIPRGGGDKLLESVR